MHLDPPAAPSAHAPFEAYTWAIALDLGYVGFWLAAAFLLAVVLRRALSRLAAHKPSAFREVIAKAVRDRRASRSSSWP